MAIETFRTPPFGERLQPADRLAIIISHDLIENPLLSSNLPTLTEVELQMLEEYTASWLKLLAQKPRLFFHSSHLIQHEPLRDDQTKSRLRFYKSPDQHNSIAYTETPHLEELCLAIRICNQAGKQVDGQDDFLQKSFKPVKLTSEVGEVPSNGKYDGSELTRRPGD